MKGGGRRSLEFLGGGLRRVSRIDQWIELMRFGQIVAGTRGLTSAFVNACEMQALLRGFIHYPSSQVYVFELEMNLNVFRRVNKNGSQDFDCVRHLPMTRKDLCFGNLSDDEGIVKGGGLKVQRSGRAYNVR